MTGPVSCSVCGTVIADFMSSGLASAMTDHVAECDAHSYQGCKHKGPCWIRTNQPNRRSER